MPENCDAACVKIIIDTGMGSEAARLYAGVIARHAATRPIDIATRPIDIEVALFYARGVETIIQPVALALNKLHLTTDQHERLMAQVDKQCYRADHLIAWAQAGPDDGRIPGWTDELLAWAKDDQTFYTELAAEIGSGGGAGSRKKASASGHK